MSSEATAMRLYILCTAAITAAQLNNLKIKRRGRDADQYGQSN